VLTRSTGLRASWSAIAAAACLTLGVAGAAAGEASDHPARSSASANEAFVDIQGDASADDVRVALDVELERYLIDDVSGISPTVGCLAIDAESVACERNSTDSNVVFVASHGDDRGSFAASLGAGRITAYGGSGNDALVLEPGSSAGARLWGNRGNDRLIGAAAADSIVGKQGQDQLRGLDGDDKLIGGTGVDALVGGRGDDLVNASVKAKHHDRDEVIRCGPGEDVAIIDRAYDPEPIDCEVVRRRP
jgi:Ca2+-binding RTX toxin-like protein